MASWNIQGLYFTSRGFIWYRDTLKSSLSIIKKDLTHVWLKLNKDTIDCDKDLFIRAAYIPLSESHHYNDNHFEELHSETSHFQAQKKCCPVETLMLEQVQCLI